MARGDWVNSPFRSFNHGGSNDGNGRAKLWSYKRTILLVCSINIAVALYALCSLYTSLYMYSYNYTTNEFRYTAMQIKKIEDSLRIRQELEPKELVRLVKQLENRYLREKRMVEMPEPLKWKIAEELLVILRAANASGNANGQLDAVESWREAKLREANIVINGEIENSSILPEEADVLSRALDFGWSDFSESIGFWIPVQIINKEHDDKPDGVEEVEDEILPGKKLPPECNTELHTDYGGAAVRWGLTHHKESAYECCMACLDHAKNANPGETKCNIWVYCPTENGCHSPDIYEHKNQECWLKYEEQPKQSFKDRYSDSYRSAHPNAPLIVPWVSGVISLNLFPTINNQF